MIQESPFKSSSSVSLVFVLSKFLTTYGQGIGARSVGRHLGGVGGRERLGAHPRMGEGAIVKMIVGN